MGTTLHYSGKLKSKITFQELKHKIIENISHYDWDYKIVENLILLSPHASCEDVKLRIKGNTLEKNFTKTEFSPQEIHFQIVELFWKIKPLFASLNIIDDSGVWYRRINNKEKYPAIDDIHVKIPSRFPKNNIEHDASEIWFWKENPQKNTFISMMDMTERDIKVSFPYLRNWIVNDFQFSNMNTLSLTNFISELELSYPRKIEIDNQIFHCALIVLFEKWIRHVVEPEADKEKCEIFSWTIAAIIEWFHGGYFNSRHKKSFENIQRMLIIPDDFSNEERTIKIVFSLMEYLKIGEEYRMEHQET